MPKNSKKTEKSEPERNRGLGRKCFNCCLDTIFANTSTLRRHLSSGTCPKGIVLNGSDKMNELLVVSKREAKTRSKRKRKCSPEKEKLIEPPAPVFNNVIKIINQEQKSTKKNDDSCSDDVDLSISIQDAIEEFSKSFKNPLGGGTSLEQTTCNKKIADVKRIVKLTKFKNLWDMFSEDGWAILNGSFPVNNSNSSKKETVASLLKFVEFLQLYFEDLTGQESTKIRRFTLRLTKAYSDFSRGVKKDDSQRRILL